MSLDGSQKFVLLHLLSKFGLFFACDEILVGIPNIALISNSFTIELWPMCGSRRGDRGSGPLLKNHKNIGFPSNIGPAPLKANVQFCWAIIGTPAKGHLNGVSLAG